MDNLQTLETNVLVEMLMERTANFTKSMTEKLDGNPTQDAYEISIILAELKNRNQNMHNTSISDPNIDIIPQVD